MSFIYLILSVAMIIFIISSFVGLFRFLRDTRKYSSYYDELQNLKDKAEQQLIDISEAEDDVK